MSNQPSQGAAERPSRTSLSRLGRPAPIDEPRARESTAGPWSRRIRKGLDAVWLRQPQRVRILVPAEKRARVRAVMGMARGLFEGVPGVDDARNDDLAMLAIRLLLATVAWVERDGELEERDAVSLGAVRVASAVTDPALAETLAVLRRRERPAPFGVASASRLRAVGAWTESLFDVRSEREVRVARRLRWGAAAAVAALVARALLGDKNLALGKSVTASSICSFTPAPLPGQDRLSRLVDGDRVERAIPGQQWAHGTFAACTELQAHPWITVDLGSRHSIDEVVVYNRSDCCWGVDDTPLSIQLSSDNVTFETVATREEPFTDDFPWRQALHHRRARYVRLTNPSEGPKNLVLNEIEIHGR